MAAALAVVHVRITLLCLWPGLFLFLSGWPQTGHAQYYSQPEVVIPLGVSGTGRNMKTPGWVSYIINFGGKRHIVFLKVKKLLLVKHLPVFTCTGQGALLEDYPFVQNDCYYHGYVDGNPESLVSLNTCFGGFQGMLVINDPAYEIKPKRPSDTFEHLIYKVDNKKIPLQSQRCGLTEDGIARQLKFRMSVNSTLKQLGSHYGTWRTHVYYLELALVVDNVWYVFRSRNMTLLQEDILVAFNDAHTLFLDLGLHLTFVGLEVWTTRNPISRNSLTNLLNAFCTWKTNSFNIRVPHDVVEFIIKKDNEPDNTGWANFASVCNMSNNVALVVHLELNYTYFMLRMVHEIGHMLEIYHDQEEEYCRCRHYKRCLMNGTMLPSYQFSNCSYLHFYTYTVRKQCLYNQPNVVMRMSPVERCGNGRVEGGEQCDYGPWKMCATDPCCFANCTLRPGAVCSSGLCCTDCRFAPSGKGCNGSSHECPDNVYLHNGAPCRGTGYCYENMYHTCDEQCVEIFGKGTKNADKICYIQINTGGDHYGHCVRTGPDYVSCSEADSLCGRIQCQNHATVHWSHINGVTCWGTAHHLGMEIPGVGKVKEGTECGLQRMCLKDHCVPISQSTCSPKKCNMRGVCNSKQNCHCEEEWSPPSCEKKGYGGSVNSGPKRNLMKLHLPLGQRQLHPREKHLHLRNQGQKETKAKSKKVQLSSETNGQNAQTSPEKK
uniref:Disintegrin and metalloproteinase domain-containing protein 20-like n=1 Tax=Prolemur simus TaxID=1328070 RepID=A0A8C9AAF3_PROSS